MAGAVVLACSSSSSIASTADGESIARNASNFDALPFVEGQLPVRVILVVDGAHALASFSSWLNMLVSGLPHPNGIGFIW